MLITSFRAKGSYSKPVPVLQPFGMRHDVNMASSCDAVKDRKKQDDSEEVNCFRAEIILKRKDDNSVLLWKCSNDNQWELPRFILKENESFRDGVHRWSSSHLVRKASFSKMFLVACTCFCLLLFIHGVFL